MIRFAMLQAFFRSFFLQTLWNFERMQNVGFAYTLAPLLKQTRSSRKAYTATLRKHLQFFNTHPYLATIVVGVAYHKEASRPPTSEEGDGTLTVLKDSMGASFGAVGDHVIWGTWRPFCALLALSVGLLVAYPYVEGALQKSFFDKESAEICARWWIIGFLALFNSLHIWLRWRGLAKAVQDGPAVVRWLQSLNLQRWASQIRRLGLLLLGALAVGYLARWRDSLMLLWMFGVLLGSMIMKRWAFSGVTIFYLVCLASVAMTYLGIHWP